MGCNCRDRRCNYRGHRICHSAAALAVYAGPHQAIPRRERFGIHNFYKVPDHLRPLSGMRRGKCRFQALVESCGRSATRHDPENCHSDSLCGSFPSARLRRANRPQRIVCSNSAARHRHETHTKPKQLDKDASRRNRCEWRDS